MPQSFSTIPTIVTHANPDWDAIGAVWLLKRFYPILQSAKICFVAASDNTCTTIQQANAVVDVGMELDATRLRFDHHQDDLGLTTSATLLVYEFLLPTIDIEYLSPIVQLIFGSDTGKRTPEIESSYLTGIHAILAGEKQRITSHYDASDWDLRTIKTGFMILDAIEKQLRRSVESRARLNDSTVYLSSDNKVRAICAPCIEAAFEKGAHVVLYQGEPRINSLVGKTYPISVSRAKGCLDPHLGDLVDTIISSANSSIPAEIIDELNRWWKHPTGFYVGRGSPKSPNSTPLTVPLISLAKLLDDYWVR